MKNERPVARDSRQKTCVGRIIVEIDGKKESPAMKTLCALFDMVPFLAAIFRPFIEISASAIDAMAVILILSTFVWASIRFLVHTGRHATALMRDTSLF
jgi:hypothetical protein